MRFKMSKAQTLIEQFYQEEMERKAQEATFTPLDVTVSSADMAVISTISKRFNKDKNLLVRDAISQALMDMFSALDPVERKMLAKESDELAKSIATEIAEEQGLDSLEVSGTNWVQQDKNCVKEEKKAEKEMALQQQKAAKMVLETESAPQESTITESQETEMLEADPVEAEESEAPFDDKGESNESEANTSSIFG